jgi:hypothetical protein
MGAAQVMYNWMNRVKSPRTPSTGRMSPKAREALEARWAAAIADPEAWRAKQLAGAAIATGRTVEGVLRAWGLA